MITKVDTTKNIKKDLLPTSRRLLQNPANMTRCKMKLKLTKKRTKIDKQKIELKLKIENKN